MKRFDRRYYLKWILCAVLVCGLVGCSALRPKVEPVSAKSKVPSRKVALPRVHYLGVPYYLHKVRWSEESLYVIARWYTGHGENARILEDLTPNLRAHDLRKGDVVFVPQELSRRTDPMPRNYARRYSRPSTPAKPAASKKSASPTNDIPEDGERPAPYGPRTYPE